MCPSPPFSERSFRGKGVNFGMQGNVLANDMKNKSPDLIVTVTETKFLYFQMATPTFRH